jgi:hypothetical protein
MGDSTFSPTTQLIYQKSWKKKERFFGVKKYLILRHDD